MSFAAIASLLLQVGPSAIRGLSHLFGGEDTAEKVAKITETAASISSKDGALKAISAQLKQLPGAEIEDLERCCPELQKELTARLEIQSKFGLEESKVHSGLLIASDSNANPIVRLARPLIALISCISGCYYVCSTPDPKLEVAGVLFALAAGYMGLRHREKGKGIV